MKKTFLAAAMITAISCPAMADDVGVRVGPVGAGVTVGEGHDHDRDRDVVVKEREPPSSKRKTRTATVARWSFTATTTNRESSGLDLAGLFKNLRRGGGFYNLRFQQMSLKKQESPIRNGIRDCDIGIGAGTGASTRAASAPPSAR
jgi:hypothetical protein